ncbi:MAG TPA: putative metal-dependent hydrolase [Puia sp.]|jgi:uncharacterized damage-inducible protein DinB
MNNPSYPIGRYQPLPYSDEQKKIWLNQIRQLPVELEEVIRNLDAAQLHSPYREGGWTVHQLVHHIADSHMNAYVRFKLGLTEHQPVLKSYEEKLWAELADVELLPVNVSITLLHALHSRWYEAIKNLTELQWLRTVIYPSTQKETTLWYMLGMYAWHGKHHVAHITVFREKNGL